jgi:hypothetical protein
MEHFAAIVYYSVDLSENQHIWSLPTSGGPYHIEKLLEGFSGSRDFLPTISMLEPLHPLGL